MWRRDILSGNSSYTLKRITTDNAITWCYFSFLFFFLLDGIKKRKLVKKGNRWLNINTEDLISDLCCIFRYFKNMWSFLLTLILLYKNIFIPSCWSKGKRACPFTEKTLILLMAQSFLLRKVFVISLRVILSSNCNVVFAFNNYDYESTCSLGRRSFRQKI